MKKFSCIALLIAVIATLAGCSGSRSGSDVLASKAPLRIGLVTWIGYGPFYIAKEKGFFDEHGVDVALQKIEGTAERTAALASGKIDGQALTLDYMIVLRSKGIDVKCVMAIDASIGGDGLVASKEIADVASLKGHEIAFSTGEPSHFFLYSVLKDAGLTMSDITPVVMDADKAGQAFSGKQIAAAVTWEPWLSRANAMADGHILVDTKSKPGLIADVLFMRAEVLETRPEDVNALIAGWYQAVDYIKENPDDAREIIARSVGISSDDAAQYAELVDIILPKVRFEGKAGNTAAFGSDTNPGYLYNLYGKISDAWLSEGVIEARDKPAQGIAPQFVRATQ
jgi:NitT/TauT family transport system substrate-binding protein